MTSRDIKSTIAIGGTIAASLPSSMKRAAQELQRLRTLQAEDEAQARKLRRELGLLSKGTDEYATKTAELSSVTGRLNLREDDLTKAGIAARDAKGGVGGLASGFGALRSAAVPAGLALGFVTAVAASLVGILGKASGEAHDLLQVTTLTGAEVEGYQRLTGYLREFTQDAGVARTAAASIAGELRDLRQVRFGGALNQEFVRGLSRAGVGVGEAMALTERDFLTRAIQGLRTIQDADERALAAEEIFRNEDARAAALQAAADQHLDAAAQARSDDAHIRGLEELKESRTLGTRIDELKQRVGELITVAADRLTPAILDLADLLLFAAKKAGYQTPAEREEIRQTELFAQSRRATDRALRGGGESPFDPRIQQLIEGGQVYAADRLPPELVSRPLVSFGTEGVDDVPGWVEDLISQSIGLSPFVGRQYGGRVRPGETTLVGEDGPELARFRPGTEIIPLPDVRQPTSTPTPTSTPDPAGMGMIVQHITVYAEITNPQNVDDIEGAVGVAVGKAAVTLTRS